MDTHVVIVVDVGVVEADDVIVVASAFCLRIY